MILALRPSLKGLDKAESVFDGIGHLREMVLALSSSSNGMQRREELSESWGGKENPGAWHPFEEKVKLTLFPALCLPRG